MTRDFVWKYEEQSSLTITSLPIAQIQAEAIILPEDRNLIMSPDSSVDPDELASPEIVTHTLKECLLQCHSYDIKRVALPPLGVEHRGIPLRTADRMSFP